MPFTSIGGISGKDVAGGVPVAFLKHNEEVLVVRAGDEIARIYKVEALFPDRIEFTYLPLKQRQVLQLQN